MAFRVAVVTDTLTLCLDLARKSVGYTVVPASLFTTTAWETPSAGPRSVGCTSPGRSAKTKRAHTRQPFGGSGSYFFRPSLGRFVTGTGLARKPQARPWRSKALAAPRVVRAASSPYQSGFGARFAGGPECVWAGQVGSECGLGADDTDPRRSGDNLMYSSDRALRTLSLARACLLRVRDTKALPKFCRIIVDEGGYRGAWIADARFATDHEWRLLACAGIIPDGIPGRSRSQPADTTAPYPRSARPFLAATSSDDDDTGNDEIGGGGSDMSISFAVRSQGGELIGHLDIVADESNGFQDDELAFLGELADDLACTLATIRAREAQSRAEQCLLRTDRALRTLSAGNRALLRAQDERQLLRDMCRVAVEQGGYAAAGVAYAEHDEQQTLRPVEWVGMPAEFMQKYHFTWADTEPGHLALGIAIRTGQPAVAKDILKDPAYAYIRDDIAKMGFSSNSAFPLRVNDEIIGCLSLAAAEPDAFADDELRLLSEMADDLSYGISTLRLQIKHRAAELAIEYMAYCDSLTGLPNRTSLQKQFAAAVSQSRQQRMPLALLLVKVGLFQEINDTLGYKEGDALLGEVALRLRQFFSESEPVARIGEDEFAVLLQSVGAEHAARIAQRLLTTLHSPVELPDLAVDARVCIGMAMFPGHGVDPDALIRRANVAAREAMRNGSGYAIYTGGVDAECTSRLALMADLRRAIDQNELLLFCQPKVNMASRGICGAEALVRWRHPQHGLIATGDFIRLAENSGLIMPLTHWVLEAAFRQCYDWSDEGIECPLSVNLSAHDVRNPMLLDHIQSLFSTWGVKPQAIQFELTESALMEDPIGTVDTLTRLKRLGVELHIDDFGIGYSSLSYLQRLPVDSIKIDQSFVRSMLESSDAAIIVQSTIDLGHNLKRSVVAEGVENQAQWERLLELGCDDAQGYFISKPMPAEQFRSWKQHSPWGT